MAAVADRLVGDLLETVSPELVLIDPALRAKARQSLDTPDDTLARLGQLLTESRSARRDTEREIAGNVDVGTRPPPLPPTIVGIPAAEHERGIEDLIVTTAQEPARSAGTRRYPMVPAPPTADPCEDDAAEDLRHFPAKVDIDDLIVLRTDEETRNESRHRGYPLLPAPSTDQYEEDATYVALRHISEHFEDEPPKKPARRALSIVSVVAALCSVAIFSVDVKLGVSELPRWLPL